MNHIAHVRLKAKALFSLEEKLAPEEKASHQWQLLTQLAGVNLIVGKGGVNTAFYVIGSLDRVVCYPDELSLYLDNLSKKAHCLYLVMTPDKETVAMSLSEKEARKNKPTVGSYVVGISPEGKRRRLWVGRKTLTGLDWTPFVKQT